MSHCLYNIGLQISGKERRDHYNRYLNSVEITSIAMQSHIG